MTPLQRGALWRLIEEYASGDRFVLGEITEWSPGARLAFTWRGTNYAPGEQTEVEVLFEAVRAGTRVTVTHRGWDGMPPAHPARHGLTGDAFLVMLGGNWLELAASLRRHGARRSGSGPVIRCAASRREVARSTCARPTPTA